VDERQGLEGEAQAAELIAQPLEAAELVAEHRRALVQELGARPLHVAPEALERPVVRALEEGAREPGPRLVLPRGAAPDAWTEAFLDLVANAPRRAGPELDELRLIAVMHRDMVGAVAQAEGVGELADRF